MPCGVTRATRLPMFSSFCGPACVVSELTVVLCVVSELTVLLGVVCEVAVVAVVAGVLLPQAAKRRVIIKSSSPMEVIKYLGVFLVIFLLLNQ